MFAIFIDFENAVGRQSIMGSIIFDITPVPPAKTIIRAKPNITPALHIHLMNDFTGQVQVQLIHLECLAISTQWRDDAPSHHDQVKANKQGVPLFIWGLMAK